MTAAIGFTVAAAALTAGHYAGDYWIQTHAQAIRKALPGRPGRRACAGHVATYTITQAWALVLASAVLQVPFAWQQVAAGLAVSAVTHYAADRRVLLQRLAAVIGKGEYWDNGGAASLDQAWHLTWIFLAALLIAGRWS